MSESENENYFLKFIIFTQHFNKNCGCNINKVRYLMNSEELMKEVINAVQRFDISDMPNIDLYMDQVTTYLNEKLKIAKRHDDDKLLTKTMINNYAKSHLLPPPEKKKYSRDHLLALILIFYFKNVVSINDVTTILNPLLDEYFQNENTPLSKVLDIFLEYTKNNDSTESVMKEYEISLDLMKDIDTKDRSQLETLTLISILCYDMFIRKLMVEKLVDSLPKKENTTPKKPEQKSSETKKDIKKKIDSKKNTKTKSDSKNKESKSNNHKKETKKKTSTKK